MADYRRWYVPGGTYFFTVVTAARAPLFASNAARELLGEILRECIEKWPFTVNAIVLLPDHLHAMWTLPQGDDRYPARWGWIKKEFTKAWLAQGGREMPISAARRRRGDHGVWQFRYWEHVIEDEHDFERHFDYLHYNPVRHGHADCPRDWLHSTFHKWVKKGVYVADWGCCSRGPLLFDDLNQTATEM